MIQISCQKAIAFCTLLLVVCGCEHSKNIDKLSKKPWIPKTAVWKEYSALANRDITQLPEVPSLSKLALMRGAAARGDGGKNSGQGYCIVVSDKVFNERLKQFEDAPIPDEFSTPERESQKKDLVTAIKDLQGLCDKKAPAKELDDKVKSILKLMGEIVTIPGQTEPVGDPRYAPRGDAGGTKAE